MNLIKNYEYKAELGQDKFVLRCLNYKNAGTFLEIGTNDPVQYNNTYALEKNYGWKGLMVECLDVFQEDYNNIRKLSAYVIGDAKILPYKQMLQQLNFPKNVDYLQIDIDHHANLYCLEHVINELFDEYKFATITFEHNHYFTNYRNCNRAKHYRDNSRELLKSRGYELVFTDVADKNNEQEDWYCHPELVCNDLINKMKNMNASKTNSNWQNIIDIVSKL